MTGLEELFHDVTPEYDDRALVHNLQGGYEQAVTLLQKRLQRHHCDVIIAAGSNGSYIKKHIDKPVVLVEPGGFDLMQALNRARQRVHRPEQRIAVVTHQDELPAFAEFCASYGLDIEQRRFHTVEDARACVAELVRQQVGAIVGTGLVTQLANDAGVAGILLYSPDSIRRALNAALELVVALEQRAAGTVPGHKPRTGAARYGLEQLLGESAAMQQLRQDIQSYAPSQATLLIRGATGTGKELVAQAVHSASPRRRQKFVAINCGAIAESLLESELFGHEEGAFTGARRGGRPGLIEAAHKGTLFLDEIGEMPLPLQTRLLRVLEEREVLRVGSTQPVPLDLRVIAASHCDLDEMVRRGRFRADLYYRLNVLRINLPTLAERIDDLPMLLATFITRLQPGWSVDLTDEAAALLAAYAWPGNLRELKNLAERLVVAERVLATGKAGKVHVIRVSAGLLRRSAAELFGFAARADQAVPEVAASEQEALRAALQDALGNRNLAAQRLGISRSTLWRRMQQYGMTTNRKAAR